MEALSQGRIIQSAIRMRHMLNVAGTPRTHVRMNERMKAECARQCDYMAIVDVKTIAGFDVENDNSLPNGALAFYTPGGLGDVMCFI